MPDGTIRLADLKPDGTFDSKHLLHIRSIWSKLAVYCSYRDSGLLTSDLLRDCVDHNTVKKAINAFLAKTTKNYYLSVYPDVVEELFMDYVDPSYFEASAPPYNGDCPGYTVFNVVLSTIHQTTYDALLQTAMPSLHHNIAFLDSFPPSSIRADVQLCGVTTWIVEAKALGQFDQMGTYLPSGMDIAPGVIISKPGLATPATTLTPGDAVKISIFNFPAG